MRTPEEILRGSRVIAVVGASAHPEKAAYGVPAAMQAAGFKIVPVNPRVAALGETILGEKVYASLRDVPHEIDIVDVFRPSEQAVSVAQQAAAVGAKALWLQQEITSIEAKVIAEQAGMAYVEDNCIAVARARYGVRHTAA